jgi:hypothetical protein
MVFSGGDGSTYLMTQQGGGSVGGLNIGGVTSGNVYTGWLAMTSTNANFSTNISTSGTLTCGGTFTANLNSFMNGNLSITGNLSVSGTALIYGITTVGNNLVVTGTGAISSTLVVGSGISIAGSSAASSQGMYLEYNRLGTDNGSWFLNQKGSGTTTFNFGDVTSGNVYSSYLQMNATAAKFAMGLQFPNTTSSGAQSTFTDFSKSIDIAATLSGTTINSLTLNLSLSIVGNIVMLTFAEINPVSSGGLPGTWGLPNGTIPSWALPTSAVGYAKFPINMSWPSVPNHNAWFQLNISAGFGIGSVTMYTAFEGTIGTGTSIPTVPVAQSYNLGKTSISWALGTTN